MAHVETSQPRTCSASGRHLGAKDHAVKQASNVVAARLLAISALMWFEKVRGGSMCLNHPEHTFTQCFPCKGEGTEGSVQANHLERMYTPC